MAGSNQRGGERVGGIRSMLDNRFHLKLLRQVAALVVQLEA